MTFSCCFLLLGALALAAAASTSKLSREEQSFFCGFKRECTWEGVGDGWKYFNQTNKNIEINGPPAVTGFNLVLVPKTPQETALVSPKMKSSFAGCFVFDYYIDGPDNASLSLEVISAKNKTKLLWRRYPRFYTRGRNDNWRQGYVQVREPGEFQLKFTAVSMGGSIALNHFRYQDGEDACPVRNKAECDFEVERSCKWNFEPKYQNASFRVIEAGQLNYLDHTSYSVRGKVVYLNWKTEEKVEAQIVSPTFLKGDTARCLTFAMRRAKDFTVRVKQLTYDSGENFTQASNVLWTSNSDLENNAEWVLVRVPINLNHGMSKIVIDVTSDRLAPSGVLMFDDLKLDNEPCAAPVNCKFGDDTCGWVMPLPYSTWSLGSGRLTNLSRIDTAKSSFPYLYKESLYTDFTSTNLNNYSMWIESDRISSPDSFCLHLQFAVDNFGEHDTFQLSQLAQSENRVLWGFERESLAQGVIHTVQIQVPQQIRSESRRFLLNAIAWQPQTRISVREVKLVHGRCDSPSTLTPTTKALTVAPTTEVPFVRSKLDHTKLILVEQMLKNARSDVQRASELITIREDPVYAATEKVLGNIEATIREIERNLK